MGNRTIVPSITLAEQLSLQLHQRLKRVHRNAYCNHLSDRNTVHVSYRHIEPRQRDPHRESNPASYLAAVGNRFAAPKVAAGPLALPFKPLTCSPALRRGSHEPILRHSFKLCLGNLQHCARCGKTDRVGKIVGAGCRSSSCARDRMLTAPDKFFYLLEPAPYHLID